MLLFSASFLAMPKASAQYLEGDPALLSVCGVWFWCGAILSIAALVLTERCRVKAGGGRVGRIGLVCFFSNLPAIIADSILIVSAVGLVAAMTLKAPNTLVFPILFLFVFSLNLHGMLNGRNFRFIRENIQYTREKVIQ